MASINEIQDQIIGEFEILQTDREMMLMHIMDLGQKLEPLDEKYKLDDNLIKGCMSKVWLATDMKGDTVNYHADSNTEITKGLISLLIRVLNGQKPQDIVDADLYFIEKIGMGNVIGSQRSNGFASMIKQMKMDALAHQLKTQG